MQEVLFRQCGALSPERPVPQVTVLLGLLRLALQAGGEQGPGLFQVTVVHLDPAQQAEGRGMVRIECQRTVQVFATGLACPQALNVSQAPAVGLVIGLVGLDDQSAASAGVVLDVCCRWCACIGHLPFNAGISRSSLTLEQLQYLLRPRVGLCQHRQPGLLQHLGSGPARADSAAKSAS